MARKTMFCIDEEVYDEFDVDEDSRERIEKARKWDLEFLTGQLNEEEIRSGRAYSVEQVYPLRNIYGRVDFELAKTLEIEFRKFVALTILNPGTPHAPRAPSTCTGTSSYSTRRSTTSSVRKCGEVTTTSPDSAITTPRRKKRARDRRKPTNVPGNCTMTCSENPP
jgi:hypothetical protein